jgi:hypothetical protein
MCVKRAELLFETFIMELFLFLRDDIHENWCDEEQKEGQAEVAQNK